jgi:hypothetical protein
MDFQQQHGVLFVADEPRNAAAFPAPQHPRPAGRDRNPLPGHLDGHAGVLRDHAVVSNWHRDISPLTRAHTLVLFFSSVRTREGSLRI